MKVLLDTAVFLWSLFGKTQAISAVAHSALVHSENELCLSAASTWEISIKYALGKLELKKNPKKWLPEMIAKMGLQPLPITSLHTLEVADLKPIHKDPFDRLLIAQARIEGIPILTPDKIFRKYGVKTIW